MIEKFSKTRMRTKKYSGSREKFEEAVSSNLEFPGRESYEILLIAAPTYDISELDVVRNTRTHLQKSVKKSCQNLLHIASRSLTEHAELKEIFLLEHPPRFDSNTRSELVVFANETLKNLIDDPEVHNKIVLGKHSLASFGIGKTFDSRYNNSILKKGDGLHFCGPCGSRDYSESLINILIELLNNFKPEKLMHLMKFSHK